MEIPTTSLEKLAAMPAVRIALSSSPPATGTGLSLDKGATAGQAARTSAFTPLPALPMVPSPTIEAPVDAGNGSETEDDDDGPPPQQVVVQNTSVVVDDEVGEALGRAHTRINAPTLDGFLTIGTSAKAQKPVRDCAAAITRNAAQSQKLAERVRLLEQGSGGQQDARCLIEFGAYKKSYEELALQVSELERRPVAAGLEGLDVADLTNSVEESRQYIIKLAGVANELSSALGKKGDEIARLKAEIEALKVRIAFRNARAELPPLPAVLAGPSVPCGPRQRSASLEGALPSPAAKRAREAGTSDTTGADVQTFWGILLGPYSLLASAKGRGLLTEVAKILDELTGAERRVGPYAVLADKNGSFVHAYFTTKQERNEICDAWPPTDPKYKSVRVVKKDNLAHPPPEALFKDVKDRKTAERIAQASRA